MEKGEIESKADAIRGALMIVLRKNAVDAVVFSDVWELAKKFYTRKEA